MSECNPKTTVLIVGGGFTGLTAARELSALGIDFQLLDAFSDHLGGRAYTYKIKPGSGGVELSFEHGAQYVGDIQNSIMALIEEHAPGSLRDRGWLRRTYNQEVMVLAGARHSYKVEDSLFGIGGIPPTLGIWDVLGLLTFLQEIAGIEQFINVDAPWASAPEIQPLDHITVAQWLQQEWLSPTVRDLMTISLEALFSCDTSEISPFYMLWYTASNHGLLHMINDHEGGPQQYSVDGGLSQVAERCAAPIADRIHRGVSVTAIDLSVADTAKVTTQTGDVWHADRVLLATAPRSAGTIAYQPELPPERRALLDISMGRTLKCQVYYTKPWWRESHGLSYNGYVGAAGHPVIWVMDNSPDPDVADKSAYVLMTFTIGNFVSELGDAPTKEQIARLVTESLCFSFNDVRALSSSEEFLDIQYYNWSAADPVVGGGPNTILSPGMLSGETSLAKHFHESWNDRVFFASAETTRKLQPQSELPVFNPGRTPNIPKYDEAGVRLPKTEPGPYYSQYSDMRESLGYLDGAVEAGRYAAHQLAKSLGHSNYDKGVDRPFAVVPMPALPDAGPPAPLDAETTLKMLTALATVLQDESEMNVEAWMKADWVTNPEALQQWLTETLVGILMQFGQITDPQNPMEILAGLKNFIEHGLRYVNAPLKDASDTDRPFIKALVELTQITQELMRTKSLVPFVPAPLGSAPEAPEVPESAAAPRSAPKQRLQARFPKETRGGPPPCKPR